MEILTCLFVIIISKILEVIFALPSMLLGQFKKTNHTAQNKRHYGFNDPIEKMEYDFDHGNLDLEDCFWLDELLGDD